MYRVLQLSDFHYGDQHAYRQLGDARGRSLGNVVVRSLERADESSEFDVLVLNGDFFTLNDSHERPKAKQGVEGLVEVLDVQHVVAVPGNHDLSWDSSLAADERLFFYDALVESISPGLPKARAFPHVVNVAESEGQRGLAVILLDSCRMESQIQAGLGLIGPDQLDLLDQRLSEAGVAAETHTLVAVMHHHLLPVASPVSLPPTADPDASPRMIVSITVDAFDVLRELARLGVACVFHGHQHVFGVRTLTDSTWEQRPPLHVAACGSCGTLEPNVQRHFALWEFDDGTAVVKDFVQTIQDADLFVPREPATLSLI